MKNYIAKWEEIIESRRNVLIDFELLRERTAESVQQEMTWTVIHTVVSTEIASTPERLAALYADYEGWPLLFPATIRGVRLLSDDGQHKTIEVDHITEGKVINILMVVSLCEIQLEEFKPSFNARFINRFEAAGKGTRYSIAADVQLKGTVCMLGPLLRPIVRSRLKKLVLEPMRAAVYGNMQ